LALQAGFVANVYSAPKKVSGLLVESRKDRAAGASRRPDAAVKPGEDRKSLCNRSAKSIPG
jgi:hypothetical protein